MSVLEAIGTRRSVRSYSDKPIDDEDAKKILDAARLAPSGGNLQRWSFVYVKDSQVLRMIKNCSPGFYGGATAAIVICIDAETDPYGSTSYSMVRIMDVGFAAENILLAAHSLGLGGCAIASFNEGCISRVINAQKNWRPILVIALGYPDKPPQMPSKKSLSELVYLDEFGKKWDAMEG